jgi:hypothetical protein
MDHKLREHVKLAAIIALIIMSILQVGILWGYQNQRIPTSFLSAIFGSKPAQVSDQMTRDNLFVPYRLAISNGESLHWMISKDNVIFKPLWTEAKTYLTDIAKGKLTPDSSGAVKWGDISSKRGFMLTFKADIKPGLLKWFLDVKGNQTGMPDIKKIMLIPGGDDENAGVMYILDDKENIYNYNISNYTRDKSFQDIVTSLENDKNNTYRVYSSMRDSNFDTGMSIKPDVLYVAKSPKYWAYNEILSTIPEKAGSINEIADVLLGSEKGRYSNNKYPDGTIQLNNNDNLYKLYTDGTLTYAYLHDSDTASKGSVGQALLNAYKFINRVEKLMNSKTDIYLSGVDITQQGFYIFKFDYMVNNLPIYTDFTSASWEVKTANCAITIDANGKQVLKCSWILRDLAEGARKEYNDGYLDYSIDYKALKIEDISSGYVLKAVNDKRLEPSIIIEKMDGAGIQAINMPVGKGS